MTNTRKEESIPTMSSVLEQLIEDAPPKVETPTAVSDTVEMHTVKESCEVVKGLNEYTIRQLVARNELPIFAADRVSAERYLFRNPRCLRISAAGRCNYGRNIQTVKSR